MAKPVKLPDFEYTPDGVRMGEPGAKVDKGKTPVMTGLFHYFPRALKAVAEVSKAGMEKGYAWKSWEAVKDGVNRYGDAMGRHILDEAIYGDYDTQPGGIKILHAAQDAWNALARLELILKEGKALYGTE